MLKYTKDICGNDLLTDNDDNQIMMEWEKPYMEACIDNLDISGSVLEVGFGLGYSARRICSSPNITEYSVIESSPEVWGKFEEFRHDFSHIKMNLIKGRWEDVLCLCKKYDRCFFDDFSSQQELSRFGNFFLNFVKNHFNMNCKIGAYSTTPAKLNLTGIKTSSIKYEINIPSYCKYAKGNIMYINTFELVDKLNEKELIIFKNRLNAHKTTGKLKGKPVFVAVAGTASTISFNQQ